MKGEGFFAEQVKALFELGYRKAGFSGDFPEHDASSFRVPSDQLSLGL
jgi:hypothetical protein